MKKGQLTMTITIGVICFILVWTMFIQFNTISKTDIVSIKNMRETELRTEISNWKTKLQDMQKKYEEVMAKKNEYTEHIADAEKSSQILESDLEEAKMMLGATDVVGNGIIVTLSDNSQKSIVADDLIELINELRLAGAEAISINNERIVINSYVADIDYKYIVVNAQRLISPYIVKAIGNQSYLESGLTAKQYGYIDNMNKALGKTVTLEKKDNITINKYEGNFTLKNVNNQ